MKQPGRNEKCGVSVYGELVKCINKGLDYYPHKNLITVKDFMNMTLSYFDLIVLVLCYN